MRSSTLVTRLALAALVGASLAVPLGGCTLERTVRPRSVVDTIESHADEYEEWDEVAAEMVFWDGVAEQPVVTNADALHGLLLFASDDEPPERYADRIAAARARGWLRENESPPRRESATIGLMATAVCEVLGVEGGLTMRMFGLSQRYCTRELIYLELIPRRTSNQSVTGLEFIDLVTRAEDYQSRNEGS